MAPLPFDVPTTPETVLLIEQMDDGPFTAQQILLESLVPPKYFHSYSMASQKFVKEDNLKPYWYCRTELTPQNCRLYGETEW